jgi:hypothetical protein
MDRETHEQTLDRVEAMLREFPFGTQRDSQSSNSTLTVNAGGAGVWAAAWVASICCTACLVAMVLGGMWMLHQAKQIDDLNAYLQAIYQQAPSLQPKEK